LEVVLSLAPGDSLSHYRLVEQIGEGGMGVVWRATDTSLGRDVAVKVLPEAVARDPERMARFEREARLLASLNHPGIAAVYGVGSADGVRFLAMELVEGDDLAARIQHGPLPVVEAIEMARQIADALEAAHEKGYHRKRYGRQAFRRIPLVQPRRSEDCGASSAKATPHRH
jgi:serine/threonine-protein kinase